VQDNVSAFFLLIMRHSHCRRRRRQCQEHARPFASVLMPSPWSPWAHAHRHRRWAVSLHRISRAYYSVQISGKASPLVRMTFEYFLVSPVETIARLLRALSMNCIRSSFSIPP
jgi:hypothetical protein